MALLVTLALLVSAADHWTTYLCLRAPVNGWQVSEANPVTAWMFEHFGLVDGLLLDSFITLVAMLVLLRASRVPVGARKAFLVAVMIGTGLAVVNNLGAIAQLGLSPLGDFAPRS